MCQGLRSVTGAPARVSRQDRMRLSAALMAFLCNPARMFSCLVDAQFRVERRGGSKGSGTLSTGCCWVLWVVLWDVAAGS